MNFKIKTSLASLALIVSIPASAQVLYKVEGNGLKNPSYIFGTHHLAPISVIEEFGATGAFNESRQVVGEIDMTQGADVDWHGHAAPHDGAGRQHALKSDLA